MAQEQLTGSNALSRVLQELKTFLGAVFATKTELRDAQVGSIFHIYVDKTTMHLMGTPSGEGTFSVRNGHLILTQTEQQT